MKTFDYLAISSRNWITRYSLQCFQLRKHFETIQSDRQSYHPHVTINIRHFSLVSCSLARQNLARSKWPISKRHNDAVMWCPNHGYFKRQSFFSFSFTSTVATRAYRIFCWFWKITIKFKIAYNFSMVSLMRKENIN